LSGESKDFDYPIPGNLLPRHLNHWDRFDVLGFAVVYCLNRISQLRRPRAHAFAASTRSPIAQAVSVSPHALAEETLEVKLET
jgi:hypothetical protein